MPAPPTTSAASVRLEVRPGTGRPAVYEVGDGGFLVGSVPGCDLRLPGTNLAPVICLIARHTTGASLRKLAPVQPVVVNGRTVSSTYLANGDSIRIGNAELVVHIAPGPTAPIARPAFVPAEWEERVRQIEARERLLQQQANDLAEARAELEKREASWRDGQQSHTSMQAELRSRLDEVARQENELEGLRQELAHIRQELAKRYQERRERLLVQQQAIRRAARKVLHRKQIIDEREARIAALEEEAKLRDADLQSQAQQIEHERELLQEQYRIFGDRQQEAKRELAAQIAELQTRENVLVEEKVQLEKSQKQHQADLVRLDRIQATIEQRQKQLEQRALEIDRRFEQMQRDSRDMEEQAAQMDEWHNRLTAESERLAAQKQEQDALVSQLDQRASALEGQQAMLATLRTRLERMREELRRQEQSLSDQRLLQEASEADIKSRLEEAEKLRSDLANDRQLFDEERRRFDERRNTLEQAIAQLRKAQESLSAEQEELQQRQEEVERTAAEQAEQAGALIARGEQLEQVTRKLQADRQMLQEREATLTRAEQTLATLQDQVRKRVEDLDERQVRLAEQEEELARLRQEFDDRSSQAEQLHAQARQEVERIRQELDQQAQALEERSRELAAQEDRLALGAHRLEETQQSLVSQRQALASERIAWEVERQAAQEKDRQSRELFVKARDEAQALARALPELELRATAALERLSRARENLREHLAEVHTYARQSREDLDAARKEVQADVERLRQQELDLQVARDEHRLAVAAFRQQLIEWQGRVGEMRQSLKVGTTQLERRQAEIEQQQRAAADISARLVEEAAELERQKRQVAERRGEMDRHLNDMREWYRRKLRELAGVDAAATESDEPDVLPMPAGDEDVPVSEEDRNPARAVLTLADEISPADRQLGELLASLELVEDDTLSVLWAEARRQRRSLRQLLLAGGYLTLYQMALIEAGNLEGLVLGPVRVIDRLPSTPREGVYRVFDPRRNVEALLRHLAEAEMHDAVHPDEFQQRFSAAANVQHGNVAVVLEVLTIAGRPAALVEWVNGSPATDWPALVSAPGVWYRLLCQAALALQAAHSAGLHHGHLDASSFVLTGQGTLKLLGLGEPLWLSSSAPAEENESVSADLAALGRLAAAWATMPASGKSKARPLPEGLQGVLARLTGADGAVPFASAQELVEELEKLGNQVPASTTAWDRLLRQVREQIAPENLRQSA